MERNIQGELTIMDSWGLKPNYSALARKYKLDRHTIKKYHINKGKAKNKQMKRKSKYDEYEEEIISLMNKPEVTIQAILKYLENKYTDNKNLNYSSLKAFTLKKGYQKKGYKATAHIRYETKAGEQLQVDWKESIRMTNKNGELFEFNVFAATLGYSRFHSFIYSKSKTTEDFIRCIIDVLNRLGGKPDKILTDNMTAIVSIYNGQKKKHQSILQLEKDLGVKIRLCKVKTPETKGKVESANRFLNWLKPYDCEFNDESDLIEIIESINNQANGEINQTTLIPPVVLFAKEKEYLLPMPNKVLLESYISNTSIQVVPQTLLVNYQGAKYSVPKSYINKRVLLAPIDNQLYIYYSTKLIIIHNLSDKLFNYDKSHYIEALSSRIKDVNIDIEQTATDNLMLFDNITKRSKKIRNKYGIRDKRGFLLNYLEELEIIGLLNPTSTEFYELELWIKKGNVFYNNPYGAYDENGQIMNFIEAGRFMEKRMENEYE